MRRFECKDSSLHASRVDDGVCDCCDGTDEARGLCADTCAASDAKEAARETEKRNGRKKKQAMAAEAAARGRQAHGGTLAFGALEGRCFKLKSSEYEYEVQLRRCRLA